MVRTVPTRNPVGIWPQLSTRTVKAPFKGILYITVLVSVPLLWRDTMAMETLIKFKKHLTDGLPVQRLSPLSSLWDMVECKQTRYWRKSWEWKRSCILIPWATGSGLNPALREAWAIETSKPAPTVIHFLQQGSIYFNKVTPLNSVTPFEGHFLTIHHSQPLRSKEL